MTYDLLTKYNIPIFHKEVVAELSAQVLCHLVGKEPGKDLGNSYRYIGSYAKDAGLSPYKACLAVITDVEKVISLIMEVKEPINTCQYELAI